MRRTMLNAFAGLLALLSQQYFAVAQNRETLIHPPKIRAQCQMDVCMWFRVKSKTVVRSDEFGTLLKIQLDMGEADHPNGDYSHPKPIQWAPTEHYVYCSKVRPAVIFSAQAPVKGPWLADILAPGYPDTVIGANRASYIEYFYVCHGMVAPNLSDPSLATQFGYPSNLAAHVNQIEIATPLDIVPTNNGGSDAIDLKTAPLNPELEKQINSAFLQARACIRARIPDAYRTGIYGRDQLASFLHNMCFAPFSDLLQKAGLSDVSPLFDAMVMQEVAPDEWQKAIEQLKRIAPN